MSDSEEVKRETVAESAKTPIPEFTAPVAEPAVKHEDFPEGRASGADDTLGLGAVLANILLHQAGGVRSTLASTKVVSPVKRETVAESAKTPIPEFTAPVAEPAVKQLKWPEEAHGHRPALPAPRTQQCQTRKTERQERPSPEATKVVSPVKRETVAESAKTPIPEFTAPVAEPALGLGAVLANILLHQAGGVRSTLASHVTKLVGLGADALPPRKRPRS
jgi:hypothetical protein